MNIGDKVWARGITWREGDVGEVVEAPVGDYASVRWSDGAVTTNHRIYLSDTPPVRPEMAALRAEVVALREELRRTKANVRDACALACAEVSTEQESAGRPAIAKGADKCIDAIASLDLEAL